MKINTKHLEALRQQQEQATGPARALTQPGGGFEAALTRQLGLETAAAPAATAGPASAAQTAQASQASMISQMLLGVGQTENTDSGAASDALDQASGTLDMWDSYVSTLKMPGQTSLRDAYALLQGIDGQVAALREHTASARGQNPGLDSLLNTLEVLSATEKFKFNRGDYS